MRPRQRRSTALFFGVLYLGACTSWYPSPISPRQLIEAEQPRVVRLTDAAGTTAVVTTPRIVRDSIVTVEAECQTTVAGEGAGCVPGDATPMIALSDVRGIELRRTDMGLTIAAILLIPVAVVAALVVGESCVPC